MTNPNPFYLTPNGPPAGFTPGNPAATGSATLVMMGLGATCTYTPRFSGRVLVTVTGYADTATASVVMGLGCRYGTGTAPVNGAAVTGTRFGSLADASFEAAAGGVADAFSFTGVITGLTPGVPVWFDVCASTTNAADAATLANVAMTMAEL